MYTKQLKWRAIMLFAFLFTFKNFSQKSINLHKIIIEKYRSLINGNLYSSDFPLCNKIIQA